MFCQAIYLVILMASSTIFISQNQINKSNDINKCVTIINMRQSQSNIYYIDQSLIRELIACEPCNAELWADLSLSFVDIGDNDNAIQYMLIASRLNPNNTIYLYFLGEIYQSVARKLIVDFMHNGDINKLILAKHKITQSNKYLKRVEINYSNNINFINNKLLKRNDEMTEYIRIETGKLDK